MTEAEKKLFVRVIIIIKRKLKYLEKFDADGQLTRLSVSNIIKDFEGLLKSLPDSSVNTDKVSVEKLQERHYIAVQILAKIREAYTNYKSYDPDEDDGYAGGDVTSSFIDEVGDALAVIGGGDDRK